MNTRGETATKRLGATGTGANAKIHETNAVAAMNTLDTNALAVVT